MSVTVLIVILDTRTACTSQRITIATGGQVLHTQEIVILKLPLRKNMDPMLTNPNLGLAIIAE